VSDPVPRMGTALVSRYGLEEAVAPVRERPGWTPPRRIVTIDETAAALIRRAAPEAEVHVPPDPQAWPRSPKPIAYVGMCVRDILEAAPKLKGIQILSAGDE